jgi:hypothetical protein
MKTHPFPTKEHRLADHNQAIAVAMAMICGSQWFEIMPVTDGQYIVTFKPENEQVVQGAISTQPPQGLKAQIVSLLLDSGESFLKDDGVDEKVCSDVAQEIMQMVTAEGVSQQDYVLVIDLEDPVAYQDGLRVTVDATVAGLAKDMVNFIERNEDDITESVQQMIDAFKKVSDSNSLQDFRDAMELFVIYHGDDMRWALYHPTQGYPLLSND